MYLNWRRDMTAKGFKKYTLPHAQSDLSQTSIYAKA